MAISCPLKLRKDSLEWQQIVSMVGSEDAAMRIYQQYAFAEDPLNEIINAYDITKNTFFDKEGKFQRNSNSVTFHDTFTDELGQKEHVYIDGNNQELTSNSRALDRFRELKFNFDSVGSEYSQVGTHFHKALEMYVDMVRNNNTDPELGRQNVKQYISDNKLPEAFFNQIEVLINNIKGGKLLSEKILAHHEGKVAGTVDLIHLRDDGRIDIYDFKTSHKTPWIANYMEGNKGRIWNPKGHYDGYKGKRYSSQLEVYSRMIENVLGQHVNNKFVVPIEIEYNTIGEPTSGIKSAMTLNPENVADYGYEFEAKHTADQIFKQKPQTLTLSLSNASGVTDLINSISGEHTSRKGISSRKLAVEFMKQPGRLSKDGKAFRFTGNTFEKFKGTNPTDAQKLAQVIEKFNSLDDNRDNVSTALISYIKTGKNSFIDDNKAEGSDYVRVVAERYAELYGGDKFEGSDLEIFNLEDIDGFKDMGGWVIFKVKNVVNLYYFGSDDIDSTFNVSGRVNHRNLFGQYFNSTSAANILKSKLKNDWGDLRKLEATLIAAKLRKDLKTTDSETGAEVDANIKIGDMVIGSTKFRSNPRLVDLRETLPILKNLSLQEKTKNLIPESMKHIFEDEATFRQDSYEQDHVASYVDFMNHSDLLYTKSTDFRNNLSSYTDGKMKKFEFRDFLTKHLNTLIPKATDSAREKEILIEEREMISKMIFQLRGVPMDASGLNKYVKDITMPQNISNRIIQDVVSAQQSAVNNMQKKFIHVYKKPNNEILKKFFDAQRGLLGKIEGKTIARNTRYFDIIMTKREMNIPGESEVSRKNTIDFTLIAEGSKEFANLPSYAQDMIVHLNDEFGKFAKRAGMVDSDGNTLWTRGDIPLVRASMANRFFKATHSKSTGKQNFGEFFASAVENVEDNFGLGEGKNSSTKRNLVENSFYHQSKLEGRSKLLGLSEDNDSIDLNKLGGFETNLEVVLDVFAMNAIRMEELNTVAGVFNAAETIFNMWNTKFFHGDVTPNIEWLKTYGIAMLHNRDVDSGSIFSKTVKLLTPITSLAMIGFKPLSPIIAFIGQQLSASSQAVANAVSKNGFATISEFAKAVAWMVSNFSLADAIVQDLGIVNMDTTSMLNGIKRYGESWVLSVKGAYLGFHVGEWASRGNMAIAEMMKDGSLAQYSLDANGKLQYDETAGTRFDGERGALELEYFKKMAEEEGTLNEDGTLQRGWDNNHINRIKAYMNAVIGGMDKEARANFTFHARGRLFGQFKSWLPARINKLYNDEFDSVMLGKMVKQTDPTTGKDIVVWDTTPSEGMFQTMLGLGSQLYEYKKLSWNDMTTIQKENTARFASDMAHYAIAVLMSYVANLAMGEDDEKDESISELILRRSLQDLLSTYQPSQLFGFFQTPALLEHTARVWKATIRLMSGSDEETTKFEEISKFTGVKQRFDDAYKLIGIDNE